MNILITGKYDPLYNRTCTLTSGLKKLSVDVQEYPFETKDRNKLRKLALDRDIILLPCFTHDELKFVKRITGKPIVFDPLISRYMSKIHDFKEMKEGSLRALRYYWKDKLVFKAADLLIADTHAHKSYFADTFSLDSNKITVIPVGVNCEHFFPLKSQLESQKFTIGFYGTFLPLQGVSVILKAANILQNEKDMVFDLIGTGHEHKKMIHLAHTMKLRNVMFSGWVDYHDLNQRINTFDICLGIFGDSLKADLVIPNKIYHYAACGKPTITKNTAAIGEIFEHDSNITLCSTDPEELAAQISSLKNDPKKAARIGAHALELVQSTYRDDQIASRLTSICKDLH